MSNDRRFLYRVSSTAELTDDDLKQNPKGIPLTNRQIDANFNSLWKDIDGKAPLKDPVFSENSVVNTSKGFLLIPVFSGDKEKAAQEGSFRFNPETSTLETFHDNVWNALTAKAAGGKNNSIFWLNDQKITDDYTIPAGKNAMTAGPVSMEKGVTVSVTDGCTWTIV